MNKLVTAASCLLIMDSAMAADADTTSCTPVATALRTDFPDYSQELGFGGSLIVGLKLGTHGEVVAARIVKSSGLGALDRAALSSARQYWRFDLSNCSSEARAREFEQKVTYRPTGGAPFSGVVKRGARKRIREFREDKRCTTVEQSHETTVVACRGSKKRPHE